MGIIPSPSPNQFIIEEGNGGVSCIPHPLRFTPGMFLHSCINRIFTHQVRCLTMQGWSCGPTPGRRQRADPRYGYRHSSSTGHGQGDTMDQHTDLSGIAEGAGSQL